MIEALMQIINQVYGITLGFVIIILILIIGGWLAFFIYWSKNPPDARLLRKASGSKFNKVLFWFFDKSRFSWLVAGKMLGAGVYETGKNEVVFLPKTLYQGEYPKELKELLGAEKHEIEALQKQDPEKEKTIQRIFDSVHRLKNIKVPVYFVYSGQGVALSPESVAALSSDIKGLNPNPGEYMAYLGIPMDPSTDMAAALGKRTTDSQLRFIAQTYRTLGKEEAEGAATKIMTGMIIFAAVIFIVFIVLWQGGYLG